jgi:hypothetical protein
MGTIILGGHEQGQYGHIVKCSLPAERPLGRAPLNVVVTTRCTATATVVDVMSKGSTISAPPLVFPKFEPGPEKPFQTGEMVVPESGSTLTVHVRAPCADGKNVVDLYADCLVP